MNRELHIAVFVAKGQDRNAFPTESLPLVLVFGQASPSFEGLLIRSTQSARTMETPSEGLRLAH